MQSCKLTLYLCQWSCVVQCVDLNLCLLSCRSSSVGECYVLVSPPWDVIAGYGCLALRPHFWHMSTTRSNQLQLFPWIKGRAALGGIRTHGTLQSRRALYQLSYQGSSTQHNTRQRQTSNDCAVVLFAHLVVFTNCIHPVMVPWLSLPLSPSAATTGQRSELPPAPQLQRGQGPGQDQQTWGRGVQTSNRVEYFSIDFIRCCWVGTSTEP